MTALFARDNVEGGEIDENKNDVPACVPLSFRRQTSFVLLFIYIFPDVFFFRSLSVDETR